MGGCEVDLSGTGYGIMAGVFEHTNYMTVFKLQDRKFLG